MVIELSVLNDRQIDCLAKMLVYLRGADYLGKGGGNFSKYFSEGRTSFRKFKLKASKILSVIDLDKEFVLGKNPSDLVKRFNFFMGMVDEQDFRIALNSLSFLLTYEEEAKKLKKILSANI